MTHDKHPAVTDDAHKDAHDDAHSHKKKDEEASCCSDDGTCCKDGECCQNGVCCKDDACCADDAACCDDESGACCKDDGSVCCKDGEKGADGKEGEEGSEDMEGCCGGNCGCGHKGRRGKSDGESHEPAMPHTKISIPKPQQMDVAEDGHLVSVNYTGTLDDGEVFDTSDGKDPIEFTLGEHHVIRGFEDGIRGLKKGAKKKITIEAADAYGDVNPELQQEVPREALGEIEPEVGMMLALQHPMAPQPIPCKIVAVTPEKVTIDLNHPLAGKRLHFDLELVEIQ